MVMYETSSENCSLICWSFQSMLAFEVYDTKKYAQLILNFFWVVYLFTFLNVFVLLYWDKDRMRNNIDALRI